MLQRLSCPLSGGSVSEEVVGRREEDGDLRRRRGGGVQALTPSGWSGIIFIALIVLLSFDAVYAGKVTKRSVDFSLNVLVIYLSKGKIVVHEVI